MKYLIWVLVIIVVGFGVWKLIQTKPDANVPQAQVTDTTTTQTTETQNTAPVSNPALTTVQVDNANVKVAFKGFGPGKVHNGSFSKVTSTLYSVGDVIGGGISVDVASLTSDTEKLTMHLNSKDFFDTAVYKTATFKITGWTGNNVTGTMTIRNIAKNITFPVTFANNVYTADFTLNMKDFGIDQKFANEEIQLIVTIPVK